MMTAATETVVDGNGCVGLCCAAFWLPGKGVLREKAKISGPDSEAAHILDMIIPLTPKEARERNHRFGGASEGFKWKERGHHFTCRHWDEETRLCTDYENRPPMCRDFPYEREDGCPFGCSCKGKAI